jgi:predicted MFS family arabinose efflux permease
LLHGLTFSALWVAGVSYANEVAPKDLGATAQGLFTGMTMGLGSAGGALLGGLLYDSLGPTAMFRVAASCVLVGLLFFAVAGREKHVES